MLVNSKRFRLGARFVSASVRDPLRVRGGEPVTAMTACGAYSMYYCFPFPHRREPVHVQILYGYTFYTMYYILYISRRRGCAEASEGSKFPARPTSCLSIDHRTWPSKPVMGHATQSGGINQVAGDAATATAISNLKSVSDRSHEPRGEANNCCH